MKKKKLLTQTEFAKEIVVTRQTVQSYIRRGIISINKNGKIHADIAKKIIDGRRQAYKARANLNNQEFLEARQRKLYFKAELAELKLKELKESLISIDDVREINKKIYGICMKMFLAIPGKVAPKLVGAKSIKEKESIINKEVRDTLNKLARLKKV